MTHPFSLQITVVVRSHLFVPGYSARLGLQIISLVKEGLPASFPVCANINATTSYWIYGRLRVHFIFLWYHVKGYDFLVEVWRNLWAFLMWFGCACCFPIQWGQVSWVNKARWGTLRALEQTKIKLVCSWPLPLRESWNLWLFFPQVNVLFST